MNEFLRLEFFEVTKELFLVMNFDNFEFVKDLFEFYKMFFFEDERFEGYMRSVAISEQRDSSE